MGPEGWFQKPADMTATEKIYFGFLVTGSNTTAVSPEEQPRVTTVGANTVRVQTAQLTNEESEEVRAGRTKSWMLPASSLRGRNASFLPRERVTPTRPATGCTRRLLPRALGRHGERLPLAQRGDVVSGRAPVPER